MTQSTGDAAAPVVNGSVLEGPYWPEPVRVLSAQVRGKRVEIHAVGLESERYFSNVLELAALEAEVRVKAREAALTFAADPKHFRLAVEAHRIRLAYEYDPHFAVSVSQIDPLPHQLEAVGGGDTDLRDGTDWADVFQQRERG